MKLQDVLSRVESSKVFTYWQKENEDSYLSSFFKIIEDQEKDWWQVDFYSPKKDNITSFLIEQDVKIVGKDSKIFKKDHEIINKLNLAAVQITDQKAMQIAHELMQEKYKELKATKKIVILQNIKTTLWNISFITSGLKLLNVRIDAESGDVLEDSLKNILDFKRDAE
ncbi:MAG: hypothetical protein AABW64_01290 [Nanoarchaeota archaeon]